MSKPIAILPDHGEVPEAVALQQKALEAALESGAPLSSTPVVTPPRAETAPEEEATNPTVVNPMTAGKPIFKKIERVELEYVPDGPNIPAFNLAFSVGEVCYREHYVSMLIVTDLGFKPTSTMKFNMKHGSKTIPVIFAGAEFEFQTLGIRGISFLVDKKRQQ